MSSEIHSGHRDRDSETAVERLDRNWIELLQELRVVQTGVQLLTGLLLTLPFQPRFDTVSQDVRVVYLITVALSVGATALLIAPVSLHRGLFRQRARATQVAVGHRLTQAGIGALGLAVTGVVVMIFDTVLGPTAGLVAGVAAFVLFAGLWGGMPWVVRRGERGD
ncbi:MAG: DUF6328 family protein [Pseudonocardia sp.]